MFTFRIEYDTTLPLLTDLSFRTSYAQPLLDGSARAFLSGTFDEAGAMSGTLAPAAVLHVRGRSPNVPERRARFTAKLQR